MLHTMIELLEIRDAFEELQKQLIPLTGRRESYAIDSIFGRLDKAERLLEYHSRLFKEQGEEAFDEVLLSDVTNEEKAKKLLMME